MFVPKQNFQGNSRTFLDQFWRIFSNLTFGTNIFSCDEQLKKWWCHSVRPFVRSLVPFFSFSVFGVRSALRKFQGRFKKVSRVFQRSFKGVKRKLQGCFKEVSRLFQDSFKKVSRVFQGSFKGVSRKFQGCFKEV